MYGWFQRKSKKDRINKLQTVMSNQGYIPCISEKVNCCYCVDDNSQKACLFANLRGVEIWNLSLNSKTLISLECLKNLRPRFGGRKVRARRNEK